jgi:hypothetical protein
MRRLAERFVAALTLPVPAAPDVLLQELTRLAAEERGREVVLRTEVFPPQTATGLWMELKTHDIIVIDQRAAPWHQLVIFFHEVWHMLHGDCGIHVGDDTVAARLPADEADLGTVVVNLAARTTFDEQAEQDAERFGLIMCRQLAPWLEGVADTAASGGLAGRIGASLRGLSDTPGKGVPQPQPGRRPA